jgi:CubicO group peptidase (beta-lactamase class C family)
VHHLLTHTAGLPHWRDIPELDPTVALTAEDELRIFSDAPLLSAPGERFRYSSPGYVRLVLLTNDDATDAVPILLELITAAFPRSAA